MFKNITGFFIGENSKKRQIGLAAGMLLSGLYFMDQISLEMYEAMMPFVLLWTGAAFSARLSKLSNAVKNAKR